MNRSRLFLLDTNTTGYIISGRSRLARSRLQESLERGRVGISAITEAEIRYGLERKANATRLQAAVEALLALLPVYAWDSEAARAYGRLRARLTSSGTPLAEVDLQIAAHALALDATLVSHDQAFRHVSAFVTMVDWAQDL